MKLAYLVTDPNIDLDKSTGASTHILGTMDGFKAHGFDVKLFQQANIPNRGLEGRLGSGANSSTLPPTERSRIRIWGSDLRRFVANRALSRAIIEEILDFQPDAIYERSWLFSTGGLQLSRSHRIFHFMETSACAAEITKDSYGISSVRLANLIERVKLSRADAVVVESRAAVDWAKRKFRIKIPVLAKPLGFHSDNQEHLSKPDERISSFCDQFEMIVAFVGTFGSYQGTDLLMKAIEAIHESDRRIGFLLIGGGGNHAYCKRLASEKGLINVHFTGMIPQHDLAGALSRANIGIIPDCESHMSPIKALQYGALGLPALVPSYPCFDGLVDHEKEGLRFQPKDIQSLVAAMELARDRSACLKGWGASFKRKVESEYSWKEVVSEVVAHLKRRFGSAE